MSSLSRIAFVLVFLLSTAYTADDNRLTIYTAQTGYSITVLQIQNTPYVGLVDVLDPLGRTETKIDGNKLSLRFTPPGASSREFEFQAGNRTYKTTRDKPELTAPFTIRRIPAGAPRLAARSTDSVSRKRKTPLPFRRAHAIHCGTPQGRNVLTSLAVPETSQSIYSDRTRQTAHGLHSRPRDCDRR
jgi:hypothetical protein